jgi:DNA-entry nuclease
MAYRRRKKNNHTLAKVLSTLIAIIMAFIGAYFVVPEIIDGTGSATTSIPSAVDISSIPEYSGSAYAAVNGNVPFFEESDYTTTAYENYSELDSLGRCGVVMACLGKETMPKEGEERESISHVTPSGWEGNNKRYDGDIVSGGWIYNRCHLIGWQLSAENDNERNLITGTRYFNAGNDEERGMLAFENMVADYIKDTGNHVLYRVTPVYTGNNLVANGILMEAYSVEDEGDGICFNVYFYNVQPGVEIDYATGANKLAK